MGNDQEHAGVKEAVSVILEMLHLLQNGEVTADQLREKLAGKITARSELEAAYCFLDVAVMLNACPDVDETPRQLPAVKNPRFRRGSAMQPSSWSKCLWKPPGAHG